MDRAYMVLATYDGSWDISPYPGLKSYGVDMTVAATHVWRGGCLYVFDDENGLKDALDAAGYNTLYDEKYVETYTDDYGPTGAASCT